MSMKEQDKKNYELKNPTITVTQTIFIETENYKDAEIIKQKAYIEKIERHPGSQIIVTLRALDTPEIKSFEQRVREIILGQTAKEMEE